MREIRLYGSEGGGAGYSPYPYQSSCWRQSSTERRVFHVRGSSRFVVKHASAHYQRDSRFHGLDDLDLQVCLRSAARPD
jgi:hypothetical protein